MDNNEGKKKRLANLKPVKPGEVRNPTGRPKGAKDGVTAHLRRLLQQEIPEELREFLKKHKISLPPGTYAKSLAKVLLLKGVTGKLTAIQMILNQTEDEAGQEVIILLPEDLADGYAAHVAGLQADPASDTVSQESGEVQGDNSGDSEQ